MIKTGTRVVCDAPGTKVRIIGTLAGRYKDPRTNTMRWLVVTDQKSDSFQAYPDIGIDRCTIFVDFEEGFSAHVERLNPHSYISWKNVPPYVGVYAERGFVHDGIEFPRGTVGRVYCYHHDERAISVLWKRMVVGNDDCPDERFPYLHHWVVPAKYIKFGTVDLEEGRVITAWEDNKADAAPMKPQFQEGDMVISTRAVRAGAQLDHTYSIVRGTVLKVLGADRTTITAYIVGNCQEKMIGLQPRIDVTSVKAFPFVWIPGGQKVRVIQEVEFRKKSLQGRTAKVLSPTDQDGDVGVEFPEDIGAGSLDGLGQDGRCLFIPSKALEISE